MLGATILIDTDLPQFRIDWPVLISVALASLAIMVAITRLAFVARRKPVVSGREQLIGAPGTVTDWEDGRGHVFVHGERWQARSISDVPPGASVCVTDLDGLVLTVVPTSQQSAFAQATDQGE